MSDAIEVNQPIEAPEVPQAPAEPANQEQQAKPAAPQKPSTLNYEKTGDRAVDGALKILSRAGVAQDSFEMDAARQGNFAPLKAVLQHLGAEDGDIALQLLESAYAAHIEGEKAAKQQLQKTLLDIAGGAKEWDAALKFIDANASPEESEELVAALEAGGKTAEMAARYMTLLYQVHGSDAAVSDAPKEAPPQSPRASQSRAGGGNSDYISSDDYYRQYQALVNSGARENDPRIIRLNNARLRSIKADGY